MRQSPVRSKLVTRKHNSAGLPRGGRRADPSSAPAAPQLPGPPGAGSRTLPCPALPCPAQPGVGAAAERAGEGGRAAGLPLSRLGPGLA